MFNYLLHVFIDFSYAQFRPHYYNSHSILIAVAQFGFATAVLPLSNAFLGLMRFATFLLRLRSTSYVSIFS